MKWQVPYEIKRRTGSVNYEVELPGWAIENLHVNLLKAWVVEDLMAAYGADWNWPDKGGGFLREVEDDPVFPVQLLQDRQIIHEYLGVFVNKSGMVTWVEQRI